MHINAIGYNESWLHSGKSEGLVVLAHAQTRQPLHAEETLMLFKGNKDTTFFKYLHLSMVMGKCPVEASQVDPKQCEYMPRVKKS